MFRILRVTERSSDLDAVKLKICQTEKNNKSTYTLASLAC